MDDQGYAQTIEGVWTAINQQDFDALERALSEDAVQEWPQSGERIRGRDNIMAINRNYPGLPKATLRRVVADGNLVVSEATLDYGGKIYHSVSIFELQNGKVVKETDYFAEPFEAPRWRAQWVEKM